MLAGKSYKFNRWQHASLSKLCCAKGVVYVRNMDYLLVCYFRPGCWLLVLPHSYVARHIPEIYAMPELLDHPGNVMAIAPMRGAIEPHFADRPYEQQSSRPE